MGILSEVYGNSLLYLQLFCESKTILKKRLYLKTKQKSQAYNKVENNPEFVVS